MRAWVKISLLLACLNCHAQPLPLLSASVAIQNPSSSFDPSQLTGMVVWTSITNGVTNTSAVTPPNDGDSVQGWADLSGNVFPLLKLGTVRPVYHATGGASNNSPYLSFAAGGSCSMTNATGGGTKAFPLVYFIVMNFTTSGGINNGATINAMADQNPQALVNGTGSYGLFDNGSTWSPSTFSFNQVGNNVWFIWTIKMSGTAANITTRTNGVVLGSGFTGSMGTLPSHGVIVGNYFNQTLCCGMNIVEFIWYSGNDMSSSDMLKVEKYLANKYNIKNSVIP